MKILSYGFFFWIKISHFSKVHSILKIRWFMLGFAHALFYDLYMCSITNSTSFSFILKMCIVEPPPLFKVHCYAKPKVPSFMIVQDFTQDILDMGYNCFLQRFVFKS